jgi:hypothetical protein
VSTVLYLAIADDVDPEMARKTFLRIVRIFDRLGQTPSVGSMYGSDDQGPNLTKHIRPDVHGFHWRADEVRR